MPNYRNKNRNRNKNKQRNKQQQQQQQQQQKQKEENCKKESKEPTTATTTTPTTINTTHSPENSTTTPTTTSSASPLTVSEVTNISAVSSENNVAEIVDTSTTKKSNQFDVCENVQSLKQTTPDVTTATEQESEANVKTTETNDTVLNEPSQCDNKSKNNHGVKTNDIMGNEKSKMIDPQRDISSEESNIQTATTDVSPISPSTCALGKVIVHRIVCEDSNSVNTNKELTTTNAIKSNESSKEEQSATPATEKSENEPFKVIIHKILTEPDVVKENEISSKELDQDNNTADSSKPTTKQTDNISQQTQQEQQQVKVIVHKVITAEEDSETTDKTDSNNTAANAQHSQQHEVKVIVHKVDKTEEVTNNNTNSSSNESASQQHEVKVIVHKVSTSDEEDHNTQQQQKQQHQHQQQAKVIVHQVHLEDKDNEPQITSPTMKEPLSSVAKTNTSDVRIVEISDESLSDLEELRSPVISEAESSVEYSDDIQKVADSITEVTSSSSSSSASSSQKQSRKQKRIALENHFLPQMLNPRFLDSISEENSELSDNSENPLSRSASNESATNCPSEGKVQKLNAKYPKSSLDFSKSHKQQQQSTNQRKSKVIREEPIAVAVAARLQDAPDADESCTTVSSCMSPEAEAAEVVFISNSASSSMSDLHDMDLFENVHTSTPDFDLDTDLRDIINKPVTENICFESLTSSAAPSAFTAKIPKQQLPEFCANQNNNNQTINNSKLINKNTPQTPYTASATATNTSIATNTTTKTRSLAETKTNSNINSKLDSILLSSSSSPANEQLVFAQIEEQISSVLSSINEVASQNTNTTIATTSTSSSSSSTKKIHTNLSNTQKLPVTTTSTTVASRTPENSCEESFNTNSSSSLCAGNNAKTSRVFSQDVNMNTVRDLIINNNNNNVNDNNTVKLNGNNNENSATNGYVKLSYNNSNTFTPIPPPPPRGSPPPPPIPPLSQEHEPEQTRDECDNTSNSAFNPSTSFSNSASLPLLQKHVDYHNSHTQSQHDLPKGLNSALSLLTSSVIRQESMDSHCSDSTNFSQCTAINVAPEQSSDSVQTSSISDLKTDTNQQCEQSDDSSSSSVDPKKLRLLCAETLASFPYGDAVLEELATVAQNIGEARAVKAVETENNMPYPLPELPHIDDLQLSLKVGETAPKRPEPPQQQQDQSWLGVPTSNDPQVLVCLSPSQRSYIQQKPEQKPDDLLDAHQKFVERRGYHEYTKEQLQTLEREKLAEQQLLQTAAMMKKLRKSITPPPPQIPPPPVPVKSSETASKAQNLSKRTVSTTTVTHTQTPNDDVNLTHNNEQMPTASNGENNGEENKHRLLSIIQDTGESNANKQIHSVSSSSSYENNSRQTTNSGSAPVKEQVPSATSTLNNGTSTNSHQFPQLSEHKGSGNMQSVETTLGQMFPTMGSSNIFDHEHKRFSNIESSNTEPFCSQIMNTQPKRYSSVETHSYETQKRIENGKVVQDFSTSKHETKTSGDKPSDAISSFPLKTAMSQDSNSFLSTGKEQDIKHNSPAAPHKNDQEIMSALNLNKHSSDIERKQQTATQSETTIRTTIAETSQNIANDENKSAKMDEKDLTKKQEPENTALKRGIQDTYEEFRQRAKAAADAASTLPTLNLPTAAATTAKVTSNGDNNGEMISSTTTTTEHKKITTLSHDHEKLFKEFDDLSKQLHRELETSKAEREQRERSASMFDLNRVHMRQKQQIEEFNKSRHEHLKELEQEIERSMKSRSLRFSRPQESATDTVDYQAGRTYQIPIHIENGNGNTTAANKPSDTYDEAPPVPEPPKTYQIPIQIESSNPSYVDDARFRRAESMFNLGDDAHHRQRTYSNQTQFQRAEDDWSKYASDLGSSENIARPFAKEVEICYQRRPGGIRAPRLSASTNDLSFNNQHSYDHFNAYNVRRHHAPMLNRAPENNRPKFGSCYSMIERDPNPKYISTTTRRGVSPAPQTSGFFPLDGCHVREEDMRQRRASLPREIHEQQLKYIANKEEELRTEFERLQNERRRLMEEAQKAQAMQMAQTPTSPITRPLRDLYRSTQKLPTLTEDEVFRQQMAEEWLNKVAEREKRRLQNIIKISKIHEDEAYSKHKANMEEEFLSRVKERRHKLAMPADSDWESGAESQPTTQAQLSEAEDIPPVKIIEGEKEASLRRLPRHLREFAKFSNHQKEEIEGGHREEHQEEERSEETTDNSVSKAFKKSSVVKTVKTLRAPMLPENGGHDNKLHYHKSRAYQIPQRPRDPYSTDRLQRRTNNKQTRFAAATNRRSWSESDLLQEIDKDLKLAKGFLFQDVYNVKHEYMSEPETENERPRKMAQLGRRQYDGIGPITNDGMPIILRSEVKEPHQHEWYKRLYQTIHKQKHGDDCVIRYKQPRGRTQYSKPNGYQSEPEPNYDSDYSTIKYRAVNPNRLQSVSSALNVRKSNDTLYGTLPNPVKSGQNSYKNQPGRIEDYVTGHSSVSEKEKKEWWDEIMDIFNVQLDQTKLSSHYTEGNLSRALAKESGYTSDSNLVFRKKELPQSSPLSPVEQKQAYKNVQAGGEPPLFGFRKPAPEKSKDYDFPTPQLPPPPKGELLEQGAVSPNRYYESDVNIHFKTPVRQEFKYPLSEEELAIRQAEQMQKLYQEERRRKYLQELQDMNSRRHTDNFTPSQKSPIPLNRYDDFPADLAPKAANQIKSIARALYNFQAQNSKELSFKKGDIIYIKRAIDKNWYEGEHNAMIGLFPANYVEIINKETVYPVQSQAPVYRKPSEGQARAKYNFQAQSGVELSLNKGELVSLTRRVDDNWFEGRIANRKGIFPVSYVEVLTDIGAEDIAARTTTVPQTARPSLDALRTNINNEFNTLTRNGNQPPNAILRETRNAHKTDILHVDTSSEPLVYRALYKYRPQNSDELELQEGDIVHVLEKCDDGWYVGTSQRTGCFGTFPGNYVERV
ncbi:serine-rich adhesin for platelets isoform X9 [Lucilia cuprina]|uniref:serine-rich adhesin for platelets isoform X9 n=1 Tax=Lucilia cuprina TaxID=7375 RepID=UPI001F058AD4|nr:serine-rich adhesin for platelets isoform X9 [Lucilia cuprina]